MNIGKIHSTNVNNTKTKKDPVTKGARIGAGIAIGLNAADTFRLHHNLKKATGQGIFKNFSSEIDKIIKSEAKEYAGNKKFRALMFASASVGIALATATRIGLGAAAGGGLGLLVKGHNEKNEADRQTITEQTKVELEKE